SIVHDIFGKIHTLKGETGFANLPNLNRFFHHLETLLDRLRKGSLEADRSVIDLLLKVSDELKYNFGLFSSDFDKAYAEDFSTMIEEVEKKISSCKEKEDVEKNNSRENEKLKDKNKEEQPVERIEMNTIEDKSIYIDFISESNEHLDSIEEKVLEFENEPENMSILNEIFRPLHTIKGVSGFLSLNHINKLSHTAENYLDAARQQKVIIEKDGIDLILEVVDVLRKLITLCEIQLKGDSFEDSEYPEVAGITEKVGAFLKGENDTYVSDKQAESIVRKKEDSSSVPVARKSQPVKEIANIKVDIGKLDNLIDMVGELVISESMISQNTTVVSESDRQLSKNVLHLNKIVRDIQYVAMSLRMVPVKPTFQKMGRLVRDLANKSGKKVNLQILGAETELDKNVIEQINDPLVHMIRNSVDHGIESTEEREKIGKSSEGTVTLNAFHEGGNIIIQIRDDGKGLNVTKIRQKAIDREIISESDELNDTEMFNLIFEPGFSTADKITDVSGRGVGMDVVKRNIQKLGGNVRIESKENQGSVFSISLPLTMAIMDGMIIRLGTQRYLIPILSIVQSVRPKENDVATVQGKGEMLRFRGEMIRLIRLSGLFGEKSDFHDPEKAIIVIVEHNGRHYGLMVDEILGQQQAVIKSLEGDFGKTSGASGCAILGDGRVGLILDIKEIADLAKKVDLSGALEESGADREVNKNSDDKNEKLKIEEEVS
ncbi:MAG: chemotaxis protein CheW, partial [Fibrobacterota bacterium]